MQQSPVGSPPPYDAQDLFRRLGIQAPIRGQPTPAHNAGAAQDQSAGLLTRVCKDGERTQHLTHIAGRLIAQGWTTADTELACVAWNRNNNPPLDEQKVLSTVQSIAKTHARNRSGQPAPESHIVEPLFDPAATSVKWMLRTQPHPRDWLLTDCLPLGVVGMVVAPGGTGKSQLMLQLGVSVATGIALCDHWQVDQKGAALLLFAEDEYPEIHRRLRVVVDELAPSNPGMSADIEQNLRIKSMVGTSNLMTYANTSGRVSATDYVDRVVLAARQIPNLRLLVVDPASRFRGGNENSADDATRFIEQLERLSTELRCTVIVCQHVNKASMNAEYGQSQTAVRGSSALTDGVRWQMNLSRPSEKDAAKKYGIRAELLHEYLVASVPKNNYAPPQPQVVLHRKPGGYLVSALSMKVAITLEDRIEQLIQQESVTGHSYSKNQVENQFGGETGPLLAGKNAVRAAIDEMLKTGRLVRSKNAKLSLPVAPRLPPPAVPSPVDTSTRGGPVARVRPPVLPNSPFLAGVPSHGVDPAIIEAIDKAHQAPMADASMRSDTSTIDPEVSPDQEHSSHAPIPDHRTESSNNQ